MARTTPAQNPRGLRRSTRLVFVTLPSSATAAWSRVVVVTVQVYQVQGVKRAKLNHPRCICGTLKSTKSPCLFTTFALHLHPANSCPLQPLSRARIMAAVALQLDAPFRSLAVVRAILTPRLRHAETPLHRALLRSLIFSRRSHWHPLPKLSGTTGCLIRMPTRSAGMCGDRLIPFHSRSGLSTA